ncbi:MAG: hypothetical protein HDT42_01740 [Ruminococcaceae bacterium]|nr:hypothetical protein [Oscillospiraceae bacterium]
MGLFEDLAELGVDIDDAITRFMNNSALYEKMLKKLPKVVEDSAVIPYIENGDYETALSNAHNLKGVMGNLSILPLYKCYTDVMNLFRTGNREEARLVIEQNIELQQKVVDCILKYS